MPQAWRCPCNLFRSRHLTIPPCCSLSFISEHSHNSICTRCKRRIFWADRNRKISQIHQIGGQIPRPWLQGHRNWSKGCLKIVQLKVVKQLTTVRPFTINATVFRIIRAVKWGRKEQIFWWVLVRFLQRVILCSVWVLIDLDRTSLLSDLWEVKIVGRYSVCLIVYLLPFTMKLMWVNSIGISWK